MKKFNKVVILIVLLLIINKEVKCDNDNFSEDVSNVSTPQSLYLDQPDAFISTYFLKDYVNQKNQLFLEIYENDTFKLKIMIDELVYDDMQIIPNYKSKNDVQLIKISTSQFILAVVYRNTEQNYIDTYLLEVNKSGQSYSLQQHDFKKINTQITTQLIFTYSQYLEKLVYLSVENTTNYINTLEVSNNKFTTLTKKKQKISQCKRESYVINNFLSFYRGQVVLVCQKFDLQKFEVHIVDISLNTVNAVHKYKFEKEVDDDTFFFDFQLVSDYQDKIVVLALQDESAVIFSFNFQLELTCTQSYNYRTDFQRIQDLFNIVIWGDSVFLSYKTRYFYSLVEIDTQNCQFTQEQKTQISYEYPHVSLAIRTGPKVTVFNFVLQYYIPIFDYKDNAYIKYSTGNIFQYKECPDNCSGSCINESECLYCSNTSNNLFVCNECDENFYLQGNQCVECQVGECECDIYSNDMINLSCQTCDADTKTCLTCDTSKNRVLSSGECVCDSFFEEQEVNGKLECVNTDSFFNEETLSGIANAAGTAVASGFLGSGMIFMNPGILLTFLDQLQMIEYIIYTQIQFPSLVYSYFEVFSMFNLEFGFIPGLVPINKNYMPAPLGFEKNDMDSFIFRNIAQYFVFSVALLASYFVGYFINKVISKQIELGALFYLQSKKVKTWKQLVLHLLRRMVKRFLRSFRYNIILTGFLGAYLTSAISALLQISTNFQKTPLMIFSTIFALILWICLMAIPFFIIISVMSLQKIKKEVQFSENVKYQDKKTHMLYLEYQNMILRQMKKKFDKKFSILFEEYKDEKVAEQLFYVFVTIRKLFFAVNLVIFNNYPIFNQFFFVFMNITMISLYLMIKPYQKSIYLWMQIISETMLGFMYIFSVRFTIFLDYGEIGDQTYKYAAMGVIIMATAVLLTEVCIIMYEQICSLIDIIKKIIHFIKTRKQKQQLIKRPLVKGQKNSQKMGGKIKKQSKIKNRKKNDIIYDMENELNNQNQKNQKSQQKLQSPQVELDVIK